MAYAKVEAFRTKDGSLFATAEEAARQDTWLQWQDRLAKFAASNLFPYKHGGTRGRMALNIVVAWEQWKAANPAKEK